MEVEAGIWEEVKGEVVVSKGSDMLALDILEDEANILEKEFGDRKLNGRLVSAMKSFGNMVQPLQEGKEKVTGQEEEMDMDELKAPLSGPVVVGVATKFRRSGKDCRRSEGWDSLFLKNCYSRRLQLISF